MSARQTAFPLIREYTLDPEDNVHSEDHQEGFIAPTTYRQQINATAPLSNVVGAYTQNYIRVPQARPSNYPQVAWEGSFGDSEKLDPRRSTDTSIFAR